MYKLFNQTIGIGDIHFVKGRYFIHLDIENRRQVLCECTEDLIPIWQSPENGVYTILFTDDFFVYCSRTPEKMTCRSYSYTVLYEINSVMSCIDNDSQYDLIYFGYSTWGFIRMNLSSGKIEQVFSEQNNAWLRITDKYVIRFHKFDGLISVSDYSLNVVWAHNLYPIASFTDKYGDFHPGEIRNTYVYKDKVIVLAGVFVFVFNIETGELIWKYEQASYYNMCIVGNIGYLNTNAAWGTLNLDTGEYHSNGRYHDIDFKGHSLWATGGELTYHKGLLWLNVFTNGLSFIIAMHPETGKYEWIHRVEDADYLNPPKFHNNRMYLLDINRNLYVYEKE
jgi:hypothetical protein